MASRALQLVWHDNDDKRVSRERGPYRRMTEQISRQRECITIVLPFSAASEASRPRPRELKRRCSHNPLINSGILNSYGGSQACVDGEVPVDSASKSQQIRPHSRYTFPLSRSVVI